MRKLWTLGLVGVLMVSACGGLSEEEVQARIDTAIATTVAGLPTPELGPRGIQGPRGPQGAQGPRGFSPSTGDLESQLFDLEGRLKDLERALYGSFGPFSFSFDDLGLIQDDIGSIQIEIDDLRRALARR